MAGDKGFIKKWTPTGDYQWMLADVQAVIEDNRADWPLSQRAWLYLLVAQGWDKRWETGTPTSVAASKKPVRGGGLQKILDKGRRAGLIPWDAVHSARGSRQAVSTHHDAEGMAELALMVLKNQELDHHEGQQYQLVLWLEADGLIGKVKPLASKYQVELLSGQGFDTVGSKYDLAVRISESDKPVKILHIGDRDISGESVWTVLETDVRAFVRELGGELIVERIAATDSQIDEYDLGHTVLTPEDAAAKKKKCNHGGDEIILREAQAEAFKTADLLAVIEDAIVSNLDMGLFTDRQMETDGARLEAAELLQEMLK